MRLHHVFCVVPWLCGKLNSGAVSAIYEGMLPEEERILSPEIDDFSAYDNFQEACGQSLVLNNDQVSLKVSPRSVEKIMSDDCVSLLNAQEKTLFLDMTSIPLKYANLDFGVFTSQIIADFGKDAFVHEMHEIRAIMRDNDLIVRFHGRLLDAAYTVPIEEWESNSYDHGFSALAFSHRPVGIYVPFLRSFESINVFCTDQRGGFHCRNVVWHMSSEAWRSVGQELIRYLHSKGPVLFSFPSGFDFKAFLLELGYATEREDPTEIFVLQ